MNETTTKETTKEATEDTTKDTTEDTTKETTHGLTNGFRIQVLKHPTQAATEVARKIKMSPEN